MKSSEYIDLQIFNPNRLPIMIKSDMHLMHSPLYEISQLSVYEHPPFLSGKYPSSHFSQNLLDESHSLQ